MLNLITKQRLTPPIKWHGGKHYLARKIVSLMPPHIHYVEPYFGGGAVLLAKDPTGISEVVNDLNPWLTNFWDTLRNPKTFEAFRRRAEATPFSQPMWEWAAAAMDAEPDVRNHGQARAALTLFVLCRQSMTGMMRSFAPLTRNRVRRRMNEQASAWLSAVEGLPSVHARLQRVVIVNQSALSVIRNQDGAKTLFYLDPPYVHETRSTRDAYGAFEMSGDDHADLLSTIRECKGKVMISGYDSAMYRRALRDWTRHTFELPNNVASGPKKARMTEVLWCNF